MIKRDLIDARKEFLEALSKLESIMTSPEVRSYVIRDSEWVESANAIYESFSLKADNFSKKVSRIIEKLPSGRGRPKKAK